MSDILSVVDLSVRRGKQAVLSVDHLTVQEGEVLAVIGPNGAGKSTLLLVLAQLLPADSGKVLFRGSAIQPGEVQAYRRRMALVLQEPLLLSRSVYDNVAAGLRYRRVPKTTIAPRVNAWLKRLGIAHLADRHAHKLSGGEAQRVSLARAFALQPEILLLDEPFSALDAPTRANMLQDLHAVLAETRITTIFITHDLDEALLLGDQVAVLLDGRLRQVGTPQQVFSAPMDIEVAAFVGVETVIAGQISAVNEGQLIISANGVKLEAVGDGRVGQPVLYCLRPEDITLWPTQTAAQGSSARNRLNGRVERLTPNGPLVRVVVDCSFPVVALVTRSSAQELELRVGTHVTATFKATAAHLIRR
jgi:molybdopterin-binding protein